MLRLARVLPAANPVYISLSPSIRPTKHDPPAHSVVSLNPTVFNHPIRRDILHLCVVHHRDSLRQGTASTKTRAEVKGSGRKIIRQKGTGRARVGDAQSPIRRGGGVAFGPKPRDFSTKLNRKVLQMGLRVALSVKLKEHAFGVINRLDWPNGRTKFLAERLKALGHKHTLFVTGEPDLGLVRAIRNIPFVKVLTPEQVNVWELVKWPRLILDLKAVEFLERTLRKDTAIPSPPSSQ